jgi:hypothetical protein
MRANIRSLVAALSLFLPLLVVAPFGVALADNAPPAPPTAKQIALTEKQIQNAVAAKADIEPIMAKLPEGGGEPDAKTQSQLEAAVKKRGFANYAEFEDVDDNINLVLGGVDPQTKKYVGDEAVLKQEIAEVQGDKQMAPKDKKEALAQLNDSLKAAAPLQFPANIPLVLKYYDRLAESEPAKQ